jgi:histidinol-phosphate aminotransferase
LSTPNNPTGNSFSESKVLRLISASPGIVVVDEAYQPFSSKRSLVPLIRKYENLAVLRTLSKVGLAALRVGVLIANERIVSEVNKVRLPFNLNALSEAAAVDALRNPKRMALHIKRIRDERRRLMSGLERIDGVMPFGSDANFILFKVDRPGDVHSGLIERSVLVRNLAGAVPGCLRVTVGTRAENNIFIKALREVIT